jgi:uncharacterized protein
MTWRSGLYVGSLFHRRLKPKPHRFRYRLFWFLLDLDEIPALSRNLLLFSHNRANWFSFRDRDHGDGSQTPLREQVETTLRAARINPPGGRVLLQCSPRTFGVSFNPLSVYYCFDRDDTLAAIIHQVHNTFGGRHAYALAARGSDKVQQACDKAFFVSPFMDMGLRYAFDVTVPGDRIALSIKVSDETGTVLLAALAAQRRPLTDGALLRAGLAVPAVGLKTLAAIHWEALRLWAKGVRFLGGPATYASRLARLRAG